MTTRCLRKQKSKSCARWKRLAFEEMRNFLVTNERSHFVTRLKAMIRDGLITRSRGHAGTTRGHTLRVDGPRSRTRRACHRADELDQQASRRGRSRPREVQSPTSDRSRSRPRRRVTTTISFRRLPKVPHQFAGLITGDKRPAEPCSIRRLPDVVFNGINLHRVFGPVPFFPKSDQQACQRSSACTPAAERTMANIVVKLHPGFDYRPRPQRFRPGGSARSHCPVRQGSELHHCRRIRRGARAPKAPTPWSADPSCAAAIKHARKAQGAGDRRKARSAFPRRELHQRPDGAQGSFRHR